MNGREHKFGLVTHYIIAKGTAKGKDIRPTINKHKTKKTNKTKQIK